MVEATIKERPILFSAPMVQAILAGRKTVTRRIVKAKDPDPSRCITLPMLLENILEWRLQDGRWFGIEGYDTLVYSDCPYGKPGERLWVREAHCMPVMGDCRNSESPARGWPFAYRADVGQLLHRDLSGFTIVDSDFRWRPSIFMPRAASRITLEVVDVRVERLQDITEEDATKEGFESTAKLLYEGMGPPVDYKGRFAVELFEDLWEQINGRESWDANPWVWRIEFKRLAS